MGNMRVIVWNLQTFGDFTCPNRNRVVCDFVAHVAGIKQANVIVIQELTFEGQHDLAMMQSYLRSATGADWEYDWLPGAIKNGTNPAKVLDFDDLAFTGAAHNEGYGVLFKIDPYTSIPALTPFPKPGMSRKGYKGKDPFISLVTHGAQIIPNVRYAMPLTPATSYVRSPLPFAIPTPAPIFDPDPTRRHNQSGIDGALSYDSVRRPCWVQLNTGAAPVQLVVYHAPVSYDGSYNGTGVCGLIEQVQDLATFPDVIVAGDFNNITPNHLQNGFENFIQAGLSYGTGDPTNGFERSVPRFTVNNWGATLLQATDPQTDFYGNPRDQLLYRFTSPGLTINTSEVIDVMSLLLTSDSELSEFVKNSSNIRNFIDRNLSALPAVVQGSASIMNDLRAICTPTSPTPFPDHRTAATFFRVFITDHFPVFIDFDY